MIRRPFKKMTGVWENRGRIAPIAKPVKYAPIIILRHDHASFRQAKCIGECYPGDLANYVPHIYLRAGLTPTSC